MLRAAAFLAAIALTAPCCAQEDSAQQPFKLKIDAQLVLIDVSVTDRKTGAVIHGLQPTDFLLTEDGTPQAIAYLSQDTLPLSVAFLFDLTDTVSPVLDQLAAGAKTVLAHLRPDDEAAILTFSNHVELIEKYTTDRSHLISAISEAAAGYDKQTPTFAHEDVFTATELTQHTHDPQSRKVQIWLTDGTSNDQGSSDFQSAAGRPEILHTRGEATEHLLRSGAVAALLLAHSQLTLTDIMQRPSDFGNFNHYADLTGGPIVEASAKDAVPQLAAMIDALRQRYTLGYRPKSAKSAGTLCHITLKLTPAFFAAHPFLRPKDLVLRTREAYIR